MKLWSKPNAAVHVDFSSTFVNFSFDGVPNGFDGLVLTALALLRSADPPVSFALGLSLCAFEGRFRENETEMFLLLMITRPGIDQPDDAIHITITGRWNAEAPKPSRVN